MKNFFNDVLIFLGFRTRYFYNPDKIKVRGKQSYRQLVKDTFWHAAALLEAKGYCKDHKHKIETFEFRPGTHTEAGKEGWAVWDSANKMWIAGQCGLTSIMIVVDPNTGNINAVRGERDMVHEWGHALLTAAGVAKGDWHKQHEIMGF